ncbi:hypothetical protein E4U43_007004 [Claviceps pusilla]|uniref:V-type c subunit family protein n=1 Tax=Claviceps pusilla TaxID=123648 RepID=A0A9P7NDG9_9HYPO|nr:hypothetical protein E4U43_007004 [Claviceps pusilla]
MVLLGVPRFVLRSLAPGCSIVSRRHLSTLKPLNQSRFSYFLSSNDKPHEIIDKLHGSTVLENPDRQNAAVVLASPKFAEHLDDSDFNSELVKVLSSSGITKDFHLLCAIVDDIAPAPGEPFPTPGISVLRGDLDSLLPQLWQPDPPLEKLERDSVAALTFKVGLSTQTLPLMRTTFLNNKNSTLLISRHDLSGGRPRLEERTEKQWQNVHVEVNPSACSVADFGLWAPLSPVTRARQITASFGNIVRAIEVDGQSIPASAELEAAVNSIFEHQRTAETTMGPMGVWALVTPKESQTSEWTAEHAPNPSAILKGKAVTRADVDSCVDYLQRQHQAGSRFYQVLSGGGGWGPKKGLLSLDPRDTYFASSEEEEMEKFVRTMSNSSFAPPGAHIQFFVPAIASPETLTSSATGIVFGVPLHSESTQRHDPSKAGYVLADHFGALSTQGIYSSMRASTDTSPYYDSKLSVPGSRIYIGASETKL